MKSLIFIIYDILWLFMIVFFVPFYIFKGKFSLDVFLGRLALLANGGNRKPSIWIQAVSVGEVLAIKSLVEELARNFPSYRVVISTTTVTGKRVADRLYKGRFKVISFPFDITFSLRRTINAVNPKVFIAIETEFWPNLFYNLHKKRIPIVVLNGRISDGAYARYRRFRFITKRILSLCSYIGVQNDLYLKRFMMLGADSARITISGNIKFANFSIDNDYLVSFKKKYLHLLRPKDRLLFIAASTHNKEEAVILDVYASLKKRFPLNLLIAPRHPERVKEIEKDVQRRGMISLRISKMTEKEGICPSVFILDTVGDLFYFYSIADVCFVGGSLFNYGGHNILEPLYFSKPTLFGPYMSNFREAEEIVLRNKAALKIHTPRQLQQCIEKIIIDEDLKKRLANNALNIFKSQEELIKRNIEIISNYLQ